MEGDFNSRCPRIFENAPTEGVAGVGRPPRRAASHATIHVDGKAAGEGKLETIAEDATLSNTADFIVGKHFAGAIDFLRVSRSTLAESKTTTDELYALEFNGPSLSDFTGRTPRAGKRRDAGAIQGSE